MLDNKFHTLDETGDYKDTLDFNVVTNQDSLNKSFENSNRSNENLDNLKLQIDNPFK